MTGIDRIEPGSAAAPGSRAARAAGSAGPGFPPPGSVETSAVSTGPARSAPVALETLLALQQVDPPADRDRAARRRGQALLATLGRVQRLLLGTDDPTAVLAELRALLADVPGAADPALAAAVDHVVLRARIELVRRGG